MKTNFAEGDLFNEFEIELNTATEKDIEIQRMKHEQEMAKMQMEQEKMQLHQTKLQALMAQKKNNP